MKKLFAAALCLVLCLSLSACAIESVANAGTHSTKPSNAAVNESEDGFVLFDTAECSLTVSEVDNELPEGVTFEVIMENKSDRALRFSTNKVAVNGWQLPCLCFKDVESGDTVRTFLECDPEPIPAPLDSVDSVLMKWEVTDADDLSLVLIEDIFAFSPSGLAPDEVKIPERPAGGTEYAFIDDKDFAFAAMDIYYDGFYDNGQYGTDMLCYIENRTGTTVRTDIRSVMVNGWVFNSFSGSHLVLPGCRSYFLITLDPINLALCGIETIDRLSFDIIIQDTEWNEIASRPVTMYHTGLTADDIPEPERTPKAGETVLANDRRCTVIVDPVIREDSLSTYGLYIHNKTDDTFYMELSDLKVNGEVGMSFSERLELEPDEHTYVPIDFYDFEHGYQGDDEPKSIEFQLKIVSSKGVFEKTVFDDIVTVKN